MGSKDILVIEDHKANMKLICEILNMFGFAVKGAGSGEEAVSMLTLELPDLIITDVHLPGMDGIEFAKWVKQETRFLHIPVMILSANALNKDIEIALQAGCVSYITKPIVIREFIAEVNRILQLPSYR